jgi:hypothetical protein
MRVLAASFPDDASARAARTQLISAFRLDASQIGVEALAHGRKLKDVAILAGRFQDEVVAAARVVVEQFGGTMVIDIEDGGSNA